MESVTNFWDNASQLALLWFCLFVINGYSTRTESNVWNRRIRMLDVPSPWICAEFSFQLYSYNHYTSISNWICAFFLTEYSMCIVSLSVNGSLWLSKWLAIQIMVAHVEHFNHITCYNLNINIIDTLSWAQTQSATVMTVDDSTCSFQRQELGGRK